MNRGKKERGIWSKKKGEIRNYLFEGVGEEGGGSLDFFVFRVDRK